VPDNPRALKLFDATFTFTGTAMPRKKLIAYVFTFLAALGLCMYLFLPKESELRLLGLIVLIFWLPMALRYLNRLFKERATALLQPKASPPPAFHPREVNATLEATFSVTVGTDLMRVDADSGILDLRCLLALGTDGFSARLWRADKITGPWPSDEKLILNAEFLMPERALPRFPIDTIAKVLSRKNFIGTVRVLSVNALASAV
jgi:hypothetical protein